MHSSTQQTLYFTNRGLHPKFDIQVVHKIVNAIVEDRAMWLTDVQTQLISNFEKTQRQYKENANEHWKE
jgi:gluconate kinase